MDVALPGPPAVKATLPPSLVIAVEWPRARVTGAAPPPPPRAVRLPAREQCTVRGPVPVPAFLAVELMRLHPRPNPRA